MSNIDRNHSKKRKSLRTFGPLILILGLILLIIGISNFFASFNDPSGVGPDMFWLNFVALPLIFVGLIMTAAGFMGDVARYQAEEITPVARDVINYIADETSEGVKTIGKSFRGETSTENNTVICTRCNHINESNAKYCNNCGEQIKRSKTCNRCGRENEGNSKFCNQCGTMI